MQTEIKMLTVEDENAMEWGDARLAAFNTIGKEPKTGATDAWKKRILLAEHSPIRLVRFRWKWLSLRYWVSVHLVRHKFGIEHFVSTQRTDRTGADERGLQDAPVDHMAEANAQALINISRKRLCMQASQETRDAWRLVRKGVAELDPVVASVMVPECIYRGFCPEFRPCGYANTETYKQALAEYREVSKCKSSSTSS